MFSLKGLFEIDCGCDSVGRVVASDTRGPWFKSSNSLNRYNIFSYQLYWNDESKETRGWQRPTKTIKMDFKKLVFFARQDEINSVVSDVVQQFVSAVTGSDAAADFAPEMTSQFLRSVTQTSLNMTSFLDERSLEFVRMFDDALKNFNSNNSR